MVDHLHIFIITPLSGNDDIAQITIDIQPKRIEIDVAAPTLITIAVVFVSVLKPYRASDIDAILFGSSLHRGDNQNNDEGMHQLMPRNDSEHFFLLVATAAAPPTIVRISRACRS